EVENLSIGISNITIELTGSAAPVKVGKDVYGIFFIGSGKYTYQTSDAMEAGNTMFEAGDQKFFTFMRSPQGFFEWKYLTTKDMARLLQRIDDGKDYMPWFERYYWGTEMPEMPK